MYDKIELLVSAGDRDWDVSLEEQASNLDYDHHRISRVGNFVLTERYIDNVLMRGSLAKFYHGENMTPLSLGEIEKALDMLGKASAYNLRHAKVCALEFGSSFIVKHPACEYLQLLGNCKNFKRMICTSQTGKLESVTYCKRKGQDKFIAYDKVAEMTKGRKQPGIFDALKFTSFNKNIEMKDKRRRIPDLYKGANVIRLEYTIKNPRIRAIFGDDLKAYDLTDYRVYHTLQKQFCEFYKSISKTGRGVFINPASMKKKTSTQLRELVVEQLRQLHPDEYDFLLQGYPGTGIIAKIYLSQNPGKRQGKFH